MGFFRFATSPSGSSGRRSSSALVMGMLGKWRMTAIGVVRRGRIRYLGKLFNCSGNQRL